MVFDLRPQPCDLRHYDGGLGLGVDVRADDHTDHGREELGALTVVLPRLNVAVLQDSDEVRQLDARADHLER